MQSDENFIVISCQYLVVEMVEEDEVEEEMEEVDEEMEEEEVEGRWRILDNIILFNHKFHQNFGAYAVSCLFLYN